MATFPHYEISSATVGARLHMRGARRTFVTLLAMLGLARADRNASASPRVVSVSKQINEVLNEINAGSVLGRRAGAGTDWPRRG